jgi:hypothetical protein
MQKQFTPCPACGALGEVNCSCQFCGTTIILKEGTIATDSRIVKQRTVTPQQYAEKIYIYHNVKPAGLFKIVSIGNEYGVANLNGDLVYPLGSDEIEIMNNNTIILGYTKKITIKEASTYWDSLHGKWKHQEELARDILITKKYFNLDTSIYADEFGFIKDKEHPNKLYRVNVNKNWEPINTYINLVGEKQSFEYAEAIEIKDVDTKIFLLHNGNECSLWLADDNTDPEKPIYIINGIQKYYRIEKQNEKIQIILKTLNNIEVALSLAELLDSDDDIYTDFSIEDIYKEWNNITKDVIKRITKNISLNTNLLAQIEAYITEITNKPNINKYLGIYFFEEYPIFFIENNTINTNLSNKPGVSLTTSSEIQGKNWLNLEVSNMLTVFNENNNSAIYIDFSFDAKSLCATIQYLAQLYDCPIKNITIKQSKYDTPANEEDKVIFKIIGVLLIIGSLFFFYFGFEYSEMFIVSAICAITSVFCIKYANKV